MLFKLSNLNSNLALTLGYLNPTYEQLGPDLYRMNFERAAWLTTRSKGLELNVSNVSPFTFNCAFNTFSLPRNLLFAREFSNFG